MLTIEIYGFLETDPRLPPLKAKISKALEDAHLLEKSEITAVFSVTENMGVAGRGSYIRLASNDNLEIASILQRLRDQKIATRVEILFLYNSCSAEDMGARRRGNPLDCAHPASIYVNHNFRCVGCGRVLR